MKTAKKYFANLLVLTIAAVLGGLAVAAAYEYKGKWWVDILCCTSDIAAGTTIDKRMIEKKIVPIQTCPMSTIANKLIIVGRPIKYSKKKGDPFFYTDFGLSDRPPIYDDAAP